MPNPEEKRLVDPPAMGERRARWGYGYQDKVATERILEILRTELHRGTSSFRGVRLADLQAGRVDDFVLVWDTEVQGNSIKWGEAATAVNWGELIGTNGLLKELADGYMRLSNHWEGKKITVRLQTNRSCASEKHHAQLIPNLSVAEFVQHYWPQGPERVDAPFVTDAWAKIERHIGLQGEDLSKFVRGCQLLFDFPQPPLKGLDGEDTQAYLKQFDALHKAIAVWLTNHPYEDLMDRQFLLAAIGLPAQAGSLVQRFPQPQIPYKANDLASSKLKTLIETTRGGYIAITGPAGVGKSTLVQDVLAGCPFFVPYYAYLPDGQGNPRDRGEALTFFQDVAARLHKFFEHRLSLGVANVAQGREALRDYMKKTAESYSREGVKTILLIDGLDHVAREIGLDRSLLLELPRPDEIPDGFLIILSSQPQALLPGIVERHVSTAVAPSSGQRIEIEGLNRPEVHEIIQKISIKATAEERDALFDACQGNPLILTYLLRLLESNPATTVDAAITATGHYAGNMDDYYRSALAVPLSDSQTRQILGLLSRAVPIIPITWLQSWPERGLIENLYTQLLAAFVRLDSGNLYFIHNSFVAFLKDETRSQLPGADLEQDERQYHSVLAERCGEVTCSDPLGRIKVFHLLRSGQNRKLLSVLSSEWLRGGIDEFVPYSELGSLILYGFAAAWELGDYGEIIRLILLDYELGQRTGRIEPGDLARKFLDLDRSFLAVSQIRTNGRVLVDDKPTLEFAFDLWRYASKNNNPELKNFARNIYLQSKPVGVIYQVQPNDLSRHDLTEILEAWCNVAPAFETAPEIVAQIARLRFERPAQSYVPSAIAVRANLFYTALKSALQIGWGAEACNPLFTALMKLRQRTFTFVAALLICHYSPSERLLKYLDKSHKFLEPDPDIDLKWGEALYESGQHEKACAVIAALKHILCDNFKTRHSLGLTDILFTVTLRRLQELLKIEEGPLPFIKDDSEEAAARIGAAARQLGLLAARLQKGESIEGLRETFRSILLFHNRPVQFPNYDRRNEYTISRAKPGIYDQLICLAMRIGSPAAEALKSEFLDLIHGPASRQFLPLHRRMFAAALDEAGVVDQKTALEIGLSRTDDATDDDPTERETACLEIATFLHQIGVESSVREWLLRASKVSAGAGSHKDYHMAHIAEWLAESLEMTLDNAKLATLEKLFRAIAVAGGDGGATAATRLLRSIFVLNPIRAASLAIELVDREILNVSTTLEALLIGASSGGASVPLLMSVYCELLSLIHPADTSDAAVAILSTTNKDERVRGSSELMRAVRTNSMPPHRIEVARALEDAIRNDGLGDVVLNAGLMAGSDDSSQKSTLYKLNNGSLITVGHVAARLSLADQQDQWNPNPAENPEFNWLSAIIQAVIKDKNHLNSLLSSFPLPDYRTAAVLAWKAQRLLDLGDPKGAREAAAEALSYVKDLSWFVRWDGAQRRVVYEALKRIDKNAALEEARRAFGSDLASGKLSTLYLLDDILEIFRFLELEWPGTKVLHIIEDYLDGVLAANRETQIFKALQNIPVVGTADEALCHFVLQFVAFPVVDVGVAARRALGRYATQGGEGLVQLFNGGTKWDSVQLEHLLVCAQLGLRKNPANFVILRDQILGLNVNESLAVRTVARRICTEQNWDWQEVRDLASESPIIVFSHTDSDLDLNEARMLVDGDVKIAFALFPRITKLLERSGIDITTLRSDFERIYGVVKENYLWADDKRFKRWMELVLARFWLNTRALMGRESAMRLLGIYALSDQAPADIELAYDYLYPIYDHALELVQPLERPLGFDTMKWAFMGDDGKRWLQGEGVVDWASYPTRLQDLHIIGERTLFIRPEWEWPREERYRGLLDTTSGRAQNRDEFASQGELTYNLYLSSTGQSDKQLVIWNSEQQLVGSPYRWCAVSTTCARALGWFPSQDSPFTWHDSAGALMVKSMFWRDGWVGLEPPRFEGLGEGWVVLATDEALQQIRRAYPSAQMHLWVERHSHGEKPYHGSWHLQRSIGQM
ncbi:MAG TPA: ATP-binding protein [Candidatus Angelobacter sp.]